MYFLVIIIIPVLISLIIQRWSVFIGRDPNLFNGTTIVRWCASIIGIVGLILGYFTSVIDFKPWIEAAVWSFVAIPFSSLLIQVVEWIDSSINKRSVRRFPDEKSIQLSAEIYRALDRSFKKNKVGGIKERKRIAGQIETLAQLWELEYHKLFRETGSEWLMRDQCQRIANSIRARKLDVYFSNLALINSLRSEYLHFFKSLFYQNLADLPVSSGNIITRPKNIWERLKPSLPFIVLLSIWMYVTHFTQVKIPSEYTWPVTFILSSLSLSTLVQAYDRNIHKRLDLVSTIKSLIEK
jgi:hypothetical protein